MDAVTEATIARLGNPVSLACNLIPELRKCAQFADFGDQLHPGVDKEADASDHRWQLGERDGATIFDHVKHRYGIRERKGELLHRRGTRFLQVIGADIHRIPFRGFLTGESDQVGGEPKRWFGRENVSPAREIFLENVVLRGAGKRRAWHPPTFGQRDIEREKPWCSGINGHGGVHPLEWNPIEQALHVADMGNRYADLSDLAG